MPAIKKTTQSKDGNMPVMQALRSFEPFSEQEIKNERLFDAITRGNLEAVRDVISKGADPNAKDSAGFTPLMKSAWRGYDEIAKFLVDNGADANAKSNDGTTALMCCMISLYYSEDIARLLIHNIDRTELNTRNDYGYTALVYAIREVRSEAIQMLEERGAHQ